jgi:hypothetical protein
MSPMQQGRAQAIATFGGAIHHPRGAPTWDIQDPVRGREGRLQLMEHRTPAPVLSLSKCSNLVHQLIDDACLVHMSLSSELIIGCVHMFATMLGAVHRASLHQCKDAPCSGATQGTMPSSFYDFFKKNLNNCVETNRTSKRFFDGSSILRKVKMRACVE